MKKRVFIGIALLLFLAGCSSPPEQKTFVHVVPAYQESIVEYEEFAVRSSLAGGRESYYPPSATYGQLPDAGDPCSGPGGCLGFCLAYRSNATQGFCSDTRTPEGCWEYVMKRNVTRIICS